MASLKEIKSRMNSVTTTKKITKAMELVATSRLQRVKNEWDKVRIYSDLIIDLFDKLTHSYGELKKLLKPNHNAPRLFIVINSDVGLCGAYNTNVIKLLKTKVKPRDYIIALGTKAVINIKNLGLNVLAGYPSLGDEANLTIARQIASLAINSYAEGKVRSIRVISTKYINSLLTEPQMVKIVPLETPEKVKQISVTPEIEPSSVGILLHLLPLYLSGVIYESMIESKLCEMSLRRTAMENATDNAQELIDKLYLEYNRKRQASITAQITEIVAGAEGE